MSWRELGVLVRQLPRESATFRVLNPDESVWGLTDHLLAAVLDSLRAANWQRSGGKGPKPKPIPRPGVAGYSTERIAGKARTMAEMDELVARLTDGGG